MTDKPLPDVNKWRQLKTAASAPVKCKDCDNRTTTPWSCLVRRSERVYVREYQCPTCYNKADGRVVHRIESIIPDEGEPGV